MNPFIIGMLGAVFIIEMRDIQDRKHDFRRQQDEYQHKEDECQRKQEEYKRNQKDIQHKGIMKIISSEKIKAGDCISLYFHAVKKEISTPNLDMNYKANILQKYYDKCDADVISRIKKHAVEDFALLNPDLRNKLEQINKTN